LFYGEISPPGVVVDPACRLALKEAASAVDAMPQMGSDAAPLATQAAHFGENRRVEGAGQAQALLEEVDVGCSNAQKDLLKPIL
jgi:hypothetical protein